MNMGYIIGSLNCCRLGTARRHDYDVLADIILSEQFDIIALQEVYKPEAIEPLQRRLSNWEVCHERPAQGRFGDYGFSFLWNTKRVSECSRDGKPSIITVRGPDMTRRPLLGRFSPSELPGGLFFEMRLINVHLCWDSETVKNDIVKRIEEFKLITGEVYEYLSNRRYGDQNSAFMPAYTIVLGDYNLSAVICQSFENDSITHFIQTKQEEKTTMSAKGYANDYDHFSFDTKRFAGVDVQIQRIDSVSKFMGGDFEQHMQKISDHVPIKFEFSLR